MPKCEEVNVGRPNIMICKSAKIRRQNKITLLTYFMSSIQYINEISDNI